MPLAAEAEFRQAAASADEMYDGGDPMPQTLTLTDHEAELLQGFLHDYLPELRREVAATDQHELRHVLVQRQELVERLLAELGRATP